MSAEQADIAAAIGRARGRAFRARNARPVAGGCINEALILEDDTDRYFVKINHRSRLDMFVAEADGLEALREAGALRIPGPLCWGAIEPDRAFLVLEYVALRPVAGAAVWRLGQDLAALHANQGEVFGWRRANFIGTTPQYNDGASDWAEFWARERLGRQLDLAARSAMDARVIAAGRRLQERVASFFAGYHPLPSLLHGDLWCGNVAMDRGGRPVLFDPAVYYGDREADVAMTELFGGFDADFYAAYRAASPLDVGYGTRRDLYNLYHVLNHFNLFGGGYALQAAAMIDRLLAEVE